MKNKFLTVMVAFFVIVMIFISLDAPTATSSEDNIPSENNTLSATQ